MRALIPQALATFRGTTLRAWSEDWPQHLMRLVVRHYAPSRPVYWDRPLSGLDPGYRTIEYQTVYRFVRDGPAFLRADSASPIRGDFPPIDYGFVPLEQGEGAPVVLAGAHCEPIAAHPGDLFRLNLSWRCTGEVRRRLQMTPDLSYAALFAGGSPVPLVWGLLPIPPTPPGMHYEQQVWLVVPRDMESGRHDVGLMLMPPQGVPERIRRLLPVSVPAARLDVLP